MLASLSCLGQGLGLGQGLRSHIKQNIVEVRVRLARSGMRCAFLSSLLGSSVGCGCVEAHSNAKHSVPRRLAQLHTAERPKQNDLIQAAELTPCATQGEFPCRM